MLFYPGSGGIDDDAGRQRKALIEKLVRQDNRHAVCALTKLPDGDVITDLRAVLAGTAQIRHYQACIIRQILAVGASKGKIRTYCTNA